MVVRQVSRCALRGHCCLHDMPVWFCCASGIRPGVCCAFCACYASHVSRFRPSCGGQHPAFLVLQAPAGVKEEPPDSPERHAEPEGDPDTETAAEGKMTGGEILEVYRVGRAGRGRTAGRGRGLRGFSPRLGNRVRDGRTYPDKSRGRQSSQPALRVPAWEVLAQTGAFSQQALDWWRRNRW